MRVEVPLHFCWSPRLSMFLKSLKSPADGPICPHIVLAGPDTRSLRARIEDKILSRCLEPDYLRSCHPIRYTVKMPLTK